MVAKTTSPSPESQRISPDPSEAFSKVANDKMNTSSVPQSQGIFTIPPPFWDFAEAGDDTSQYNMTVCSSALNHNPGYQTTPTIVAVIRCSDYFINSSITRDLFTPFVRPTLFRGRRWQGQRYLETRYMPHFPDAKLGIFCVVGVFATASSQINHQLISISRTVEQPMIPCSIYIYLAVILP